MIQVEADVVITCPPAERLIASFGGQWPNIGTGGVSSPHDNDHVMYIDAQLVKSVATQMVQRVEAHAKDIVHRIATLEDFLAALQNDPDGLESEREAVPTVLIVRGHVAEAMSQVDRYCAGVHDPDYGRFASRLRHFVDVGGTIPSGAEAFAELIPGEALKDEPPPLQIAPSDPDPMIILEVAREVENADVTSPDERRQTILSRLEARGSELHPFWVERQMDLNAASQRARALACLRTPRYLSQLLRHVRRIPKHGLPTEAKWLAVRERDTSQALLDHYYREAHDLVGDTAYVSARIEINQMSGLAAVKLGRHDLLGHLPESASAGSPVLNPLASGASLEVDARITRKASRPHYLLEVHA